MQHRVLLFQIPPLERSGYPHIQLVNLHPPLGQVIIGPMLHRFDRHIFRTVGRHQNADRRPRKALCTPDQFKSILLIRHPQIRQDYVKILLLQ